MAATGTTPSELLIDINDIIRVKTLPNTITTETHSDLLDNMVRVLSGTSTEKMYFAQIDYDGLNSALPINDPIGVNTNAVQNAKTTAPYLLNAFGTGPVNFYDNMLFEVKETDGINVDGLQFSAVTELSNYLTANLSKTSADTITNQFTVKMYGNKDNSLQKIKKVRGYNAFFGAIRGMGSYWRRYVKYFNGEYFSHTKLNNAYSASLNVTYVQMNFQNLLLTSIYYSFLGVTPNLTFPNHRDVLRTIWFNSNPKKFYSLYPVMNPSTSWPSGGGSKRVVDAAGTTFTTSSGMDYVDSKIFLLDKDGDRVYYTNGKHLKDGLKYFDMNTNTEKTINFNNGQRRDLPVITNIGTDEIGNPINPVSAIRIYQLTDGLGNYSFMVKPMGIDNILIDYIEDNTDAILYGLLSSNDGQQQMLVKFNDSAKVNTRKGNATWRLALDDYELFTLDKVTVKSQITGTSSKFAYQNGRYGKNSFRNMRFFYGYPDGTISPYSDDELYHVVNSNGCPLKRLIRKNPIS